MLESCFVLMVLLKHFLPIHSFSSDSTYFQALLQISTHHKCTVEAMSPHLPAHSRPPRWNVFNKIFCLQTKRCRSFLLTALRNSAFDDLTLAERELLCVGCLAQSKAAVVVTLTTSLNFSRTNLLLGYFRI